MATLNNQRPMPRVEFYEHHTRGLGNQLVDKFQVWQVNDNWCAKAIDYSTPRWPHDYQLVALLNTKAVQQAFEWAVQKDPWSGRYVTLVPPFGWKRLWRGRSKHYVPRQTALYDALVSPGGDIYRVSNGPSFYKLSVIPRNRVVPTTAKRVRRGRRLFQPRAPKHGERKRRHYKPRNYEAERAKLQLAYFILYVVMAAVLAILLS